MCPDCRVPAHQDDGGVRCASCGARYDARDGVHRFLGRRVEAEGSALAEQYRAVRQCDGHRSTQPDYYRMLPSVPRDHPQAAEWRIRRESYASLQDQAIPAIWLGQTRILELGAGCAWLSYRLATLGYRAVAVDRFDDEADGLGACRHYPVAFAAVQADFDRLPFEPRQFDAAVFTSSLHYSPDPAASLREAARMIVAGGIIAVMDSPTFVRAADGEAMVANQQQRLRAEHGIANPLRAGVGFLTYAAMERAFAAVGLRARWFPSRGPLAWRIRRQMARLRLKRAPAAFGVWVGR
jgi:SAM-dependent methyltransferase